MKQLGLGVIVLSAIAACGHAPPPKPVVVEPPKSIAQTPAEVHERIVPHTCAARTKLAQLMGHTTTPPAPHSEQSADSAPPPTTSVTSGSAKVATNQAYRIIAPSTVLIRTDHGLGTGIVIDAKGYVLTNYHVVAEGRKQDFITSVNVTFGELSPTGRMIRQEKAFDAVVVKADVVRDMAIIKLKDPPPKLVAAKLAKSAPQISENVIAVGHAGIGFLWAAKTCSIASVGERQQDVSMLAAFDCGNIDPAASVAEAAARKTRCTEQKKQMTDVLMSSTQGLAIQTDCAITHGDSGGPLVNAVGEVVGLNQSVAADLATVSFHVHLDEIRDFTAKYPEDGVAILPDPYCDGGFNPTLEDIDLDGLPDTLVNKSSASSLGSYDRLSLLIDLDEDQDKKHKGATNAGFDAEIGLLTVRDATYVWYDTDGDSKWDLLLFDKDNDGKPDQVYHLDADGRPTEDKDPAALPKHDLSAHLVKDAALHPRLAKIATAIGGTRYVSAKTLAAGAAMTTTPDPLLGGGTSGLIFDSDANKRPDVAIVRGTFSRGILVDADEDSIGSLKSGDVADELVKAKKVDAEVSVIVQGSSVWAMYDTNNDARFDLALMTTNGTDAASLTTTNAWRLGNTGEMTPAPEHVGRKLLRPGLLAAYPRVASAFQTISADVAKDEGLGSLPETLVAKARFRARELKGIPASSVIEGSYGPTSVMLIDVDHDTKVPAKDADLHKIAMDGKFDAEVAVVHRGTSGGGLDWIYYDTDGDGKYDLVLYVPVTGQDPTQAFRIGKNGLEPDPSGVAGKPFRTKTVFKDKAMAAKWKAIALKVFKPSSVEE